MKRSFFQIFIFIFAGLHVSFSQPVLKYTVSMPNPDNHLFHQVLQVSNAESDTLLFKMPNWMPGYYQMMYYADYVENLITDSRVKSEKINRNTWQVTGCRNKSFRINYEVKANRRFVANSFLDSTHAYIVPEANFLYIEGKLNLPVTVSIHLPENRNWTKIATGLDKSDKNEYEFVAPDFDILYDCPILIGNLEEFPPFSVHGVTHRFIAWNPGEFNSKRLMNELKNIVEAAIDIFDDIPYNEYTFIGIGPGMGGIEHLNNTTISFNGTGLKTDADFSRMLNFIGHEYFHHYNVKRIRPFELGPFDYENGNRTNQLWLSEGLTVYYEYIIARRAGISSEQEFFANLEGNINTLENNLGRKVQSLAQASYYTWSDGPFGTNRAEKDQTISYYDKGPVIGLFLDFTIRNATQNQKTLDDVMRHLYNQYYKKLNRGFTDAEFQETCEAVAGIPLTDIFEYVYTTSELDYEKYLGYGGLKPGGSYSSVRSAEKVNLKIDRVKNPTPLQSAILSSWLNE